MTSSLRAIEKTMSALWMNRRAREEFLLTGDLSSTGDCGDKSIVSAAAPADIDRRGVELYSTLLQYGHQDVMRSIYPFCAKIIGSKWEDVVSDYIETYPPQHYNLNRMASRFPRYLSENGAKWTAKYPFIVELADYEWLEMELLEQDTKIQVSPSISFSKPEEFESHGPLINPVLAIRKYNYPIPTLAERLQATHSRRKTVAQARTHVVVYRHPEHFCKFLEIGETTSKVIETAREKKQSYNELISLAVSSSAGRDPQQTVLEFIAMTEKLHELFVFVGSEAVR